MWRKIYFRIQRRNSLLLNDFRKTFVNIVRQCVGMALTNTRERIYSVYIHTLYSLRMSECGTRTAVHLFVNICVSIGLLSCLRRQVVMDTLCFDFSKVFFRSMPT